MPTVRCSGTVVAIIAVNPRLSASIKAHRGLDDLAPEVALHEILAPFRIRHRRARVRRCGRQRGGMVRAGFRHANGRFIGYIAENCRRQDFDSAEAEVMRQKLWELFIRMLTPR